MVPIFLKGHGHRHLGLWYVIRIKEVILVLLKILVLLLVFVVILLFFLDLILVLIVFNQELIRISIFELLLIK